jgi:predicted RNA-binding Zn ribbon-like protein
MGAPQLPPAIFIADAPGLDFLNSIAVPVDTQVEWLGSGEALLQWLEQSGMVNAEVLQRMRSTAVPGELDAVATQARALREWFRGFVREHMGAPLTPDALSELEPLNRLLARDALFGQLIAKHGKDDNGVALELAVDRPWRSPESLLLPVATAMAQLLVNADFRHVKACEGQGCTLMFLDTTRGRMRRWCSMAVCGNRAKQAAHRERAIRRQ